MHRRMRALDPDGGGRPSASIRSTSCRCPTPAGRSRSSPRSAARSWPRRSSTPCGEQLRAIPDLALVVLDPLQMLRPCRRERRPAGGGHHHGLLEHAGGRDRRDGAGDPPRPQGEGGAQERPGGPAPDPRQLGPGGSVALRHRPVDAQRARGAQDLQDHGRGLSRPTPWSTAPWSRATTGPSREKWTLLRGPTGMLRDVTPRSRRAAAAARSTWRRWSARSPPPPRADRPFTKTGVNGLYQRRAELGEPLAALSRDRLEEMADELLQAGRVVRPSPAAAAREVARRP